jgi:hypothetical protein
MKVIEVDVVTGTVEVIAKYNGFTPIYAYPTEDMQSIYIINQDKKTQATNLYCTRFIFDDFDDEDSKLDKSKQKLHNTIKCKISNKLYKIYTQMYL